MKSNSPIAEGCAYRNEEGTISGFLVERVTPGLETPAFETKNGRYAALQIGMIMVVWARKMKCSKWCSQSIENNGESIGYCTESSRHTCRHMMNLQAQNVRLDLRWLWVGRRRRTGPFAFDCACRSVCFLHSGSMQTIEPSACTAFRTFIKEVNIMMSRKEETTFVTSSPDSIREVLHMRSPWPSLDSGFE